MRYIKGTTPKKKTPKKKKKVPKIGDFKELVKFAYLPVRITYTERVFWEKYICVYKYQSVKVTSFEPLSDSGFKFFKNDNGDLCYNKWCVYRYEYYNLK